jgi:Ca2+-binding RTX toxin-like protein
VYEKVLASIAASPAAFVSSFQNINVIVGNGTETSSLWFWASYGVLDIDDQNANGNVALVGGNGVDFILGLEGDDALDGKGGDDLLDAGFGNDTVSGADGADKLFGGAGNDILNGGGGVDTMDGGVGNDTYIVDAAGDLVTENINEGTDLVRSSVTFTLGANVESVVLIGSGIVNATGNALDNIITGNAWANVLNADAGNDTLNGAAGADIMAGGLGNDLYYVDNALDVVSEALNAGTDKVLASVNHTLRANVENLSLIGASAINGTGNAAPNVLYGNSGDNVLNGGAGADTMAGGLGNDTYILDSTLDRVVEALNAGTDRVQTPLSYLLGANLENLTLTGTAAVNGTGNTLSNVLYGNSGDNVLNGGASADTMAGGLGNDIYYVDNALDRVSETLGAGTDKVLASVSFALLGNVENLTLTGTAAINGTGNAGANILYGNSADNVLNGGAGADTMAGGLGNDIYYVENPLDLASEALNAGTDKVLASVNHTLRGNVENLTLTGSAPINGTGNTLGNVIYGNSADNVLNGAAGNDTLYGGAGNDTLNGGAGADTMAGGLGNDIYYVENPLDLVSEALNAGTDKVLASVNHALRGNVENLTLIGAAAINGTGNTLANILYGNSANNVLAGLAGNDTLSAGLGDDVLRGGAGNDILAGGAGADSFLFFEAPGAANADRITDFVSGTDKLKLDDAAYAGIGVLGSFAAADPRFHAGAGLTAGTEVDDRVIYSSSTGNLYYDADGSGAEVSQLIATLQGAPTLAASDVAVI